MIKATPSAMKANPLTWERASGFAPMQSGRIMHEQRSITLCRLLLVIKLVEA